jgi:benzaldehyde dehydrogenase (NAD)
MNNISVLIGGERRSAVGGATFDRSNPLDHAIATRAPAATPAHAVAAVKAFLSPEASQRKRLLPKGLPRRHHSAA